MSVFGLKNNAARKLTIGQVNEIRDLYAQGYTQGSIGKHFGVSIGQIGRIVRGESWMKVAMTRAMTPAEIEASAQRLLAVQEAYNLRQGMTEDEKELAIALGAMPEPPKRIVPPSLLDGGDSPDETRGGGMAGLTKALMPLQEAGKLIEELSEMPMSDEIKARAKAYGAGEGK